MNRKLIAILSLVLVAVMLFSACNEEAITEETSAEVLTTEAAVTNDSSAQEETTAEETTTEEVTEEEITIIGTLKGYTSKGYVISEKDGITYVDGVLIANKTYSLPASYNPGDLLYECESAFNAMKKDAAAMGLNIWNASGFRSYELQESLYNRYCNRDGKEAADRYSARPGHSEHQSGLAIDLNEITSAFAGTDEGRWIAENCHKYGFILRYMKNKEAETGYMYEPWHIRYVGVDKATAIYNSGLCLEEYYGITSAYSDSAAAQEAATEEATAELTTEEIISVEETTLAPAQETTAATEETTGAEVIVG